MRLYATIESERASKSQGGNEYMDIDVTVDRVPLLTLTVRRSDDLPDGGSGWIVCDEDDEVIKWIEDEKGEKQKGKDSRIHDLGQFTDIQ